MKMENLLPSGVNGARVERKSTLLALARRWLALGAATTGPGDMVEGREAS